MMRIFPHGTIPGRKKEHETGKRLFGFAFLLLLILWRLVWIVGSNFLEMYFHRSSVECLF